MSKLVAIASTAWLIGAGESSERRTHSLAALRIALLRRAGAFRGKRPARCCLNLPARILAE